MRWFVLFLPLITATHRVVVTFDSRDIAETQALHASNHNMSVVKHYGRRVVLKLPNAYAKDEDQSLLESLFYPHHIVVEEDILIKVDQLNFDNVDLELDDDIDNVSHLRNMDWFDQTTPEFHDEETTFTSSQVYPDENVIPWNLNDKEPHSIKAETLWKLSNSTPSTVVAVLDTGLHALAQSAFLHVVEGYDFISDEDLSGDGDGRDSDWLDDGPVDFDCPIPSWHGTKVASILAARHGSGVYGVAYNASVMSVRVLGRCSTGYANDITDAIVWAIGGVITGMPLNPRPAYIVSMSLSGEGLCPSYLQSAITMAHDRGVAIVVAAGNDGLATIANTFPANCEHVISVGATLRDGSVASYSNRGATRLAPGGDLWNPIPVLTVVDDALVKGTATGTSMAVPHVSGMLALEQRILKNSVWNFTLVAIHDLNLQSQDLACPYAGYILNDYAATCHSCPAGSYGTSTTMNYFGYIDLTSNIWTGSYSLDGRYYYAGYHNSKPYFKHSQGEAFACYSGQWTLFACTDGQREPCGYYGQYGSCANADWYGQLVSITYKRGCTPCPAGTSTEGGTGMNSESWCVNCPAGQYSLEAFGSCQNCPRGTYSPSPRSMSCTNCPAGKAAQYGQSSGCEITCTAGKYSEEGASACSSCTAGKYSATAGSGTCSVCNAGYFSGTGATACTPCTAGKYSDSEATTCLSCTAGKYSSSAASVICSICDAGYYSGAVASGCTPCPRGSVNVLPESSSCSTCNAGFYKAALGPGTCEPCPDNSFSGLGASQCAPCTVCTGNLYRTRVCTSTVDTGCSSCDSCPVDSKYETTACGSTQNRICTDCQICGASTQYETQRCSGTNNRGCTMCALCPKGSYKTGGCVGTSDTVCTPCDIGQYSGTDGATVCVSCGPETFTISKGSSACLACSGACTSTQLMLYDCNATLDRVCCASADVGSYRPSCAAQESCPAIRNGSFVLAASAGLNRCMNFQCNEGYYARPSELALAPFQCSSIHAIGLLRFGIHANCSAYLETVCRPYTICPDGMTRLRDRQGNLVIDPSTNDVQCIPCTQCILGTMTYTACTPMQQTKCVKCPWSGLLTEYSYNGSCTNFIVKGFYPFQLTIPLATVNDILFDNRIAMPTIILNEDGSVSTLRTDEPIVLNVLLACQSLPSGYQYVNWLTPPVIRQEVVSNNVSFSPECDLQSSTQCKHGWYKNAAGVCQSCVTDETYTSCGWRQFRDLTTCAGLQSALCRPCRGVLPPNAVFTKAKAPFYFDTTESMPCEWDCNAGYYKVNNSCIACVKPLNSNFEAGPYRNATTLPNICLSPTNCRFFGGSVQEGCMYVCKVGWKLINGTTCEPCPETNCLPGQVRYVRSDNCYDCKSCPVAVSNATFLENCDYACNAGFFQNNSTQCQQCSSIQCPYGQYAGNCSGGQDTQCVACSDCEVGSYQVSSCTPLQNTVCAPCSNVLPAHSKYVDNCSTACVANYVPTDTGCTKCALSDNDCVIGTKHSSNCSAVDLGCQNCITPETYNWCWTGGSLCAWDCLINYRKIRNKCVYDTSKNFNPFCAWPGIVATTTVPSTTPPTTTPISTTAPPKIVYRNQIQVYNMELRDCLCQGEQLQTRLSSMLGTRIYVAGCQGNDNLIACQNFQCKCNMNSRRLLEVSYATIYLVYDGVVLDNATIFETALQSVLAKDVRVTSIQSTELPVQSITWQETLIFPDRRATTSTFPLYAIGLIIAVCIVVIGVLLGFACANVGNKIESPPPRKLNYKIQW